MELNRIMIRKSVGIDLPYINLANFYYLSGDTATAIWYAEEALKKNPNNVKVCNKIADYYLHRGNEEKAEYYRQMAKMAARKDSIYKQILKKSNEN